jgi:hypothetical protein
MIEDHKLTAIEANNLGFFKVVSSSKKAPDSPSQIFITYPVTFKSKFEVIDIFLEGTNDKGVIFKIPLKIETTDNNLLKGSFINLIQPTAISLSLSIKYIDFNRENSISVGHLVKLGNLNSLTEIDYVNYLQWQNSP